jgi:hypothetical protein
LRDKTRNPGKTPIAETTARVVALTGTAPPHQAIHCTGRAMAKAAGIAVGSAQRIWRAHQLQPHRLRTVNRSRDPGFATKLTEIVGLYVDPPAHGVVLSIDEKSRIQALDRTQPGLPIKPRRFQTMMHNYKRHGATTLFAALSVLDGTVIRRCMQRHRHLEFSRSSMLSSVKSRPTGRSMSSLAIMPPTSILKCWPGWRRHTRWENFLSNDATAHPPRPLRLDRRPPSMLIWPSTMPALNPLSGANPPRPFWPNSPPALYHQFEPLH